MLELEDVEEEEVEEVEEKEGVFEWERRGRSSSSSRKVWA